MKCWIWRLRFFWFNLKARLSRGQVDAGRPDKFRSLKFYVTKAET